MQLLFEMRKPVKSLQGPILSFPYFNELFAAFGGLLSVSVCPIPLQDKSTNSDLEINPIILLKTPVL